jgi:hypothetical protein
VSESADAVEGEEKEPFYMGLWLNSIVRSGLSVSTKMVATVLVSHWSTKSPYPYPSVATIALEASVSERTVRRAIKELVALGAVKVHNRGYLNSHGYNIRSLDKIPVRVRPVRAICPPATSVGGANSDLEPVSTCHTSTQYGLSVHPVPAICPSSTGHMSAKGIQGSDPLKCTNEEIHLLAPGGASDLGGTDVPTNVGEQVVVNTFVEIRSTQDTPPIAAAPPQSKPRPFIKPRVPPVQVVTRDLPAKCARHEPVQSFTLEEERQRHLARKEASLAATGGRLPRRPRD